MNFLENLPPVLQALCAGLFTTLLTTLGAATIFFGKQKNTDFCFVDSLSAGIMLAASFFSLLCPAMEYKTKFPIAILITLGFLLGGFFVYLCNVLFSKAERGKEEENLNVRKDKKAKLLYAAITMHNIPEGLAVGVAYSSGGGLYMAILLTIGIALQNFPEGFSVAAPLRSSGMTRRKSFFLSSLSGAIEIPSAVIGAVMALFITGLMPWALSFAAGAMIAASASELIPESFCKNKGLALLGLISGFAIMMFLDVALG